MDILFSTRKLEKLCNSRKDAIIEWGDECGKKVMRRLDDLCAADNLKIMMSLPGRCHELKGNRKGQWGLD
ncbi:MAG: killer suppression protein [Nitrososphaerales archaeon]